jgi:hypothetical protein
MRESSLFDFFFFFFCIWREGSPGFSSEKKTFNCKQFLLFSAEFSLIRIFFQIQKRARRENFLS